MQSKHYMLLPIGGHNSRAKRIAFAKLDPADYEWAKQWHWSIRPGKKTLYAVRRIFAPDGPGVDVRMHRELLRLPPGQDPEVDHKNGNGLDNRRANLRVATQAQNMQNQQGAQRNSVSGVRGVFPCAQTGRWQVRVKMDGKRHWLGRFDTVEEAEAVVIAFRRKHMPYSEMDR